MINFTAAKSNSTFSVSRLLLALSLVLLGPSLAGAIPIREYQTRVRQSVTALDTLTRYDETESTWDYATRNSETINGVRNLLPRSVAVEWYGQTFNVDNGWLHQDLDKYAAAKYSERLGMLGLILDRLQAIDDRLTEIEVGSAGKFQNKQDAAQKLSTILKRPEYARKAKGESFLAQSLERFLKWLAQLIPKPKVWNGNMRLPGLIAQIVIVILALAVIAYVLKLFLPRLIRAQRSGKKEKAKARIVLGEKLEPDQSASDLLSEAEALARRGELRAAIRMAYIALLVELAERKILSLAQYKTNRDYLRAVGHTGPLHDNMKQLTDSFERHWYGLVNANENDWLNFWNGCKRTLMEQ